MSFSEALEGGERTAFCAGVLDRPWSLEGAPARSHAEIWAYLGGSPEKLEKLQVHLSSWGIGDFSSYLVYPEKRI